MIETITDKPNKTESPKIERLSNPEYIEQAHKTIDEMFAGNPRIRYAHTLTADDHIRGVMFDPAQSAEEVVATSIVGVMLGLSVSLPIAAGVEIVTQDPIKALGAAAACTLLTAGRALYKAVLPDKPPKLNILCIGPWKKEKDILTS